MQIHELNKKPANISEQQVNEVDLVGPNSIWNVGREMVKKPSSIWSNQGAAAAKQAAYAASAARDAKELEKPGSQFWSTRGIRGVQAVAPPGSKSQITPQQQYQAVKQNAQVQQLVKNLAGQWKPQGTALAAKMKQGQQPAATDTKPTVSETRPIANPKGIKDPKELQLYQTYLNQQAAKAAKTDPQAAQKAKTQVDQELNDYADQFQKFAATRLSNLGIKMANIETDPWAKDQLSAILLRIALLGETKPESAETNAAVEEYFNIALATAQAQQQQSQQPGAVGGAARGATPAGEEEQNDAKYLQQLGLTVRPDFLTDLNTAMRRAGAGSAIKSTGNGALDAVIRLAGFEVR